VARRGMASVHPRLSGSLRGRVKCRPGKAKQPGAANNRRKHLSAMCSWAVDERLMPTNYVRDVKMAAKKVGGGFYTWTVEDVAQFEERHPVGTMARLALVTRFDSAC
jgi:hypothetical protein